MLHDEVRCRDGVTDDGVADNDMVSLITRYGVVVSRIKYCVTDGAAPCAGQSVYSTLCASEK